MARYLWNKATKARVPYCPAMDVEGNPDLVWVRDDEETPAVVSKDEVPVEDDAPQEVVRSQDLVTPKEETATVVAVVSEEEKQDRADKVIKEENAKLSTKKAPAKTFATGRGKKKE